MANVLDYLSWRGDLTLAQSPFQAIDSLILCCLSYIRFDGVVPAPGGGSLPLRVAAERFFARQSNQRVTRSSSDEILLQRMAASRRFGTSHLAGYVSQFDPETQKQFCAITVLLPDDTACIVYRGTDGTIIGWKEDFNMSFLPVVPAQKDALSYIRAAALAYPARLLRTAGHSKGGNLAVFAAASCDTIQRRILDIYSFDGPGFQPEMLKSPGYLAICSRIRSYVPQSSLIGMLLEHGEAYKVVHSSEKGIFQHDPYSWEILGKEFLIETDITPNQKVLNQAIREWIASVPAPQREEFVDALYRLLSASAGSGSAPTPNSAAEWLQVFRTWCNAEPAQRAVVQNTFNKLAEALFHAAPGENAKAKHEPALPEPQH
jgi:hypothetical protein